MDEPSVQVQVLGPLRLVVDGDAVDVRGPMRRAVLALLAFAEGQSVSTDDLIGALWHSEEVESERSALHTHVSRLRGHLGSAAARLQTHQDAYRLNLETNELDLARARSLLSSARGMAREDPAAALAVLREARALWRGPVLADLTHIEPVAAGARGCAQLHREVTDALIGCAVDAGLAEEVVGLARETLEFDPLREPAVLLLMRALAATGSAAEALRIGRGYRRGMAEDVGLDPSPSLGALERAIASGAAGPPTTTSREASRVPTTRLIGRDAEVAALHRLLASERLVTLVGPGGVGKTRVAVELARQSTPPAPVVRLGQITDPEAIPRALATAIHLRVVTGDVLAACLAVLGTEPCVLVIDNCEHLLGSVRNLIEEALTACPELRILTTSREPLGLAVEHTSRLAPLAVPERGHDEAQRARVAEVPSVALFLERATRVRPGITATPTELDLVVDIVRRLDGIPLAIELAAGRLSVFSLTDLHDRLDRSLDLLTGHPGANQRHHTLRATVDWSYQLLTPDEQRLFRALSVFVGGVDLASAEQLASELIPDSDAGTVLARLVDASMIDAAFGDATRYHMLETLRIFGQDRLRAHGELDVAQERFVRFAVDLMAWIDSTVITDREPEADAALRREFANLWTAWHLTRERSWVEASVALVETSLDAVYNRDLIEVRSWATELADDPAIEGHPKAARVLGTAAYASYHVGDYDTAERLARAGLRRGDDPAGMASCRHALAVTLMARGAYAEAVEHCLAGAENADTRHGFLGLAALATTYGGDPDTARRLNDAWLTVAGSPSTRGWGTYYAGEIDNVAGRKESAEKHYLQAVELGRIAGATFLVGVATVGLLTVRADTGRVHDALSGYRETIDYFARTGNWTHQWTTLRNLATLLHSLGDHHPATVLEAAAANAPDAPAVGTPDDAESDRNVHDVPAMSRTAVLETARRAIEHHLAQ